MKRRVRKIANFFAFNLLFFALYLNFIHKDKTASVGSNTQTAQKVTEAFSGTVLVNNSENYLQQKNVESNVVTEEPVKSTQQDVGAALKLSIN